MCCLTIPLTSIPGRRRGVTQSGRESRFHRFLLVDGLFEDIPQRVYQNK